MQCVKYSPPSTRTLRITLLYAGKNTHPIRSGLEGTRGPGHSTGVGRRAYDGEEAAALHQRAAIPSKPTPIVRRTFSSDETLKYLFVLQF